MTDPGSLSSTTHLGTGSLATTPRRRHLALTAPTRSRTTPTLRTTGARTALPPPAPDEAPEPLPVSPPALTAKTAASPPLRSSSRTTASDPPTAKGGLEPGCPCRRQTRAQNPSDGRYRSSPNPVRAVAASTHRQHSQLLRIGGSRLLLSAESSSGAKESRFHSMTSISADVSSAPPCAASGAGSLLNRRGAGVIVPSALQAAQTRARTSFPCYAGKARHAPGESRSWRCLLVARSAHQCSLPISK